MDRNRYLCEGKQMKTIIITGASKGIGKELAKKLAKKNANLVIGARSVDKLKEIEKELKSKCNDVSSFKLDVSNEKSIIDFFRKVYEKYETIDILINNAGIGRYELIKDINLEKSKELFDVNFFGVVVCCREAIKLFKKPGGKIINIASNVSFRGMPTTSIYCASKAAVKSFSESLKLEVKKLGIKVIVIYPGYVNTDFHKTANEASTLKKPILKGEISVDKLTNYIINRISKNKFENIPCRNGKILKILNYLFPKLIDYIQFKKYNKKYIKTTILKM